MERFLVFLGLLFLSNASFAKKFSNYFLEFELPTGWECRETDRDWVCQSNNEARQKEAIIIFVGKNRDESDTLTNYKAHLDKRKNWSLPNGQALVSDPKFVKKRFINTNEWIDSLHLASEVPGFYTRYLAGLKGKTAVAVTFSVHQSTYQDYRPIIEKVLNSINVFGSGYRPGENNSDLLAKLKESTADLGSGNESIYGNVGDIKVQTRGNSEGSSNQGDDGWLTILLLLIAIAFVMKKIQQNKKNAKPKASSKVSKVSKEGQVSSDKGKKKAS